MNCILALLVLGSVTWGQPPLVAEENCGCTCPAVFAFPSNGANSGSRAPFRYTWLDSVSGPPETTWTDTALRLTGTAMLHASQDAESTLVIIQGWSGDQHWVQLGYFSLHAGESVAVDWSHKFDAESAYHVVRESIMDNLPIMPQQDSFITWRFWVMRNPHGAVKEGNGQPAAAAKPSTSVLRRLPAGAVAFDAMGRRVTSPKYGVYFVRTASAALPRKVLLVE